MIEEVNRSEGVNEFIQPENHFEGYDEGMDNLRNNPSAVEFDKLCHLVFMNENGKHLMQLIVDRILVPALVKPGVADYEMLNVFFEGYKTAYRDLFGFINAHDQRMKAELNKGA